MGFVHHPPRECPLIHAALRCIRLTRWARKPFAGGVHSRGLDTSFTCVTERAARRHRIRLRVGSGDAQPALPRHQLAVRNSHPPPLTWPGDLVLRWPQGAVALEICAYPGPRISAQLDKEVLSAGMLQDRVGRGRMRRVARGIPARRWRAAGRGSAAAQAAGQRCEHQALGAPASGMNKACSLRACTRALLWLLCGRARFASSVPSVNRVSAARGCVRASASLWQGARTRVGARSGRCAAGCCRRSARPAAPASPA